MSDLMKELEEAEWIEWSGGVCPIDPGTKVYVKQRDGIEAGPAAALVWGTTDDPDFSNWHHTGETDDIIAYRIGSQAIRSIDAPPTEGEVG
mgnify:CR=1 FL=1